MNFNAQLISTAAHTSLQGTYFTATLAIQGLGEVTVAVPEDTYAQLCSILQHAVVAGAQIPSEDTERPAPRQDRIFGEEADEVTPPGGAELSDQARPMVADLAAIKKRIAEQAAAEAAEDEDGVPQG